MKRSNGRLLAALWAGPLVMGCAVYDQALLPSLTGEFRAVDHAAAGPSDALVSVADLAPRSAPIVIRAADVGSPAGPYRPLAIIRFTDPDLDFEGMLRAAIQHALSGKPDAGFGLVAISPSGADATMDAEALQRNIERVLAAMSKAGVPEDRVIFSAASDGGATVNEVRVYLLDLTQSP
ncbi:MAG TPA: hypothetical protein VIK47_02660 [Kiloniellales bacterium]